jgi:uncharacterized protein
LARCNLKFFRCGFLSLFFWLFFHSAMAAEQGLAGIPDLQYPVTDLTATLLRGETDRLKDQLQALRKETGAQLAVLLVPTTQPETIEQYALRVAEKWKLGKSKGDNGVLLLVAKDDHALRIEVGYGLEGSLNDATAKRITSEAITPKFKEGLFYDGIQAGVDRISAVITADPNSKPLPEAVPWDQNPWTWIALVPCLLLGWLLRFKRLAAWKAAGISATLGGGIALVMGTPWVALGISAVIFIGVGGIEYLFGLKGSGITWSPNRASSSDDSVSSSGSSGSSDNDYSGGGGSFGGGGASDTW